MCKNRPLYIVESCCVPVARGGDYPPCTDGSLVTFHSTLISVLGSIHLIYITIHGGETLS